MKQGREKATETGKSGKKKNRRQAAIGAAMNKKVPSERCETCGHQVPGYNSVYLSSEGKQTLVCLKCYNQKISEFTGFDFEHVEFKAVVIKDADGVDHKFHFTVRHLGDRFAVEAFETKDGHQGGYEFSVIDDIQEKPFKLFEKLIGRMRRALNQKHIYWDETARNWQITDNDVVRGTIHSDLGSSDYQRLPLMVIDGKDISWSELGRMLITYEGFNFNLEIFDSSDEIPFRKRR